MITLDCFSKLKQEEKASGIFTNVYIISLITCELYDWARLTCYERHNTYIIWIRKLFETTTFLKEGEKT